MPRTPTACGCCDGGAGAACGLQCQSKGGSATLCGYYEFADISTPPKLYRKQSFSGELLGIVHTFLDMCFGETGAFFTINWTGSAIFDKETCEFSTTGLATILEEPSGDITTEPLDGEEVMPDNCLGVWLPTKTKLTLQPTGVCCPTGIALGQIHSGNRVAELSEEDTEEDAIDRANAMIEEWSTCIAGCNTCTAFRAQRGNESITFVYSSVQVRAAFSGTVGKHYRITIKFARRQLGTADPFKPLGMDLVITVTATKPNDFTGWNDVPNEDGFETIASSCRFVLLP